MCEGEVLRSHGPIRVVIADDHEMIRHGLSIFLQAYDDLMLVGEAANGSEVLQTCFDRHPHVLLIELGMQELDVLGIIRAIRERHPDIHVIALASMGEESLMMAALEAGAFSCLAKDVPIDALADTIRRAHIPTAVLPRRSDRSRPAD